MEWYCVVVSSTVVSLFLRSTNSSGYFFLSFPQLRDSLSRLPIGIGMALQSREKCKAVAERLKDKEHLFVLGKGFAEPVAYEGALKIKETCYLHAEGYSGGALKHGPFALIEGKTGKFGATPIILIVLDDEHKNSMLTACEEVSRVSKPNHEKFLGLQKLKLFVFYRLRRGARSSSSLPTM